VKELFLMSQKNKINFKCRKKIKKRHNNVTTKKTGYMLEYGGFFRTKVRVLSPEYAGSTGAAASDSPGHPGRNHEMVT
jgi:hypothetical protein